MIDRFHNLARRRPGWFSLLITVMILAVYLVAAILAAILSRNPVEANLVQALGRGLGAVAFAIIIFRFGW